MKRYTLFHFVTGDFKALEQHLNRQAARGWELDKVGLFLARWKKTERRDLRWCVDLANPKESREARRDYVTLCREGGWELFRLMSNMYLFRSVEGMDPPPVHTDPELERKNYNRYYIRSNILGAIAAAAVIALYVLMLAGLGDNITDTLGELVRQAHTSWFGVGLGAALPVWLLWLVWKAVDFARAALSNRNAIGIPPRWSVAVNCALGLLSQVGSLLFLLGYLLEIVLGGETVFTGFVYLVVMGVALLWRWFDCEFELFPGERRTLLKAAVTTLTIFAVLVLLRVISPWGEWSRSAFSAEGEEAARQYALLEEAPVVRREDLDLFSEEDSSWTLTHEYAPLGERWVLDDYIWSQGYCKLNCETVDCPTAWQADIAMEKLLEEVAWWSDPAHREGQPSYVILTVPPRVELAPVELDWADQAWYGANGDASVLVVRLGNRVSLVTADLLLADPDLLAAVEGCLTR